MNRDQQGDDTFRNRLVNAIPHLRAFARHLCRSRDMADDLVQETLLKAWNAQNTFVEGTNLKAWTFTILRNIYFSNFRKNRRIESLELGYLAYVPAQVDGTEDRIELLALRNALTQLPAEQREALILVGAVQLSHEEAAQIAGCAVGTIKSRVSRARQALKSILDSPSPHWRDGRVMDAENTFEALIADAARERVTEDNE
jgi:RNA polymerase sigma-70 factor, ECF subfamily